MSRGKAGLIGAIVDAICLTTEDVIRANIGRDMGGQWLTVKYLNDDEEWESYTISAERIN